MSGEMKVVSRAKYVKPKPKVAKTVQLIRALAPQRSYASRSLNVLSRPPVIAVKHRSKLLYNETVSIAPTGAASTAYVYSANGLFDPNITSTGHQPMGFDQLMLLYEHYTVTSAKITVSCNNESTESAFWGIAFFPDSSVETNPQKLVENGMLKRSWTSAKADHNAQGWLTHQAVIKNINGVSRNIVGDDLYRGASDSNPTEQTYFHIFGYNSANTNATALRLDVLIEYDAVFTEPRKLAQS